MAAIAFRGFFVLGLGSRTVCPLSTTNEDDSFSFLWHAEIRRTEDFFINDVPPKFFLDDLNNRIFIDLIGAHAGYIFHDEIIWFEFADISHKFLKQLIPWVINKTVPPLSFFLLVFFSLILLFDQIGNFRPSNQGKAGTRRPTSY